MTEYSQEYIIACNAVEMVVNLIVTLLFLAFFMVHCWNVYLDFYTSARVSVSHRRRAPEITQDYKNVAYCTCLMGFFGCVCSVTIAIIPFIGNSFGGCGVIVALGLAMMPSKLFVYLVFNIRYQMVYGGSQYAIREGRVKYINAFLLSIAVLVLVWSLWQLGILSDADVSNVTSDDTDEGVIIVTDDDFTNQEWEMRYEYHSIVDNECLMQASAPCMALYVFFDTIVNIVFCYKFIKPIWQVIRLVQGSSRNVVEKSKLEKKMLFVGFKVFILSGALFLSTLLLAVFYVGAFTPPMGLAPVDQCINFICLALMTPYYPDSKYYQKLCACCIFCCDRKGYTKRAELNDEKNSGNGDIAIGAQSPGDDNDNDREAREQTEEQTVFSSVSDPNQSGSAQTQTQAVSVDTMSAVRIATNEEASAMPLDDKNTRDQASAEIELAENLNDQKETQ